MKKKVEKLMYMGLGALIAFGSYLFGTLHNDNVDAQLAPTNVEYDEIRCRSLKVVDVDGNILINLGGDLLGNSMVQVYSKNGAAVLGVDENGGFMAIFNKTRENVLQTCVNDKGEGFIFTTDKVGYKTGGLPDGVHIYKTKTLK